MKTSSKEFNRKWASMLQFMINEYRDGNPDDPRTDTELAKSILDYYVEQGIIQKRNGKYILCDIMYDA
jgi:hypothetical protein